MAKILLVGDSHIIKPNIPRYSQHQLLRPKKFPSERFPIHFAQVWQPFESIALWRPLQEDYQLVHAFNGIIPYTKKPWIVTFEVLLPYLQSETNQLLRSLLKERLALDNCRKIIALSEYAKLKFLGSLTDLRFLDNVSQKLEVVNPNFPVITTQPKTYKNNEKLEIVFIGNHIGRKGGIAALRLAQKAQLASLPITMHIVSKLDCGKVWTDFPDRNRYEADLKLLNLDNVVFHGKIPNQKVIDLLARSHFHLLPTLHDTYGYSVIESFSVATPAITTNVAALPEFVHDHKNGYLLNLELNETREWKNLPSHALKNSSEEYWQILDTTYNNLATQALQIMGEFLEKPDKPETYESMSAEALAQVQNFYNSRKMNDILDNIYSEAISG